MIAPLTATGFIPCLLLLADALPEHRVQDMFKPLGTPALMERNIAIFVMWITLAIFVTVVSLLAYAVIRFRRRDANDFEEPAQVYGSNQIELAWTVIPLLIVFTLIGVTARVIAQVQNASQPKHAMHIRLVGHQWWWEVHYPDYGFVTANDIHMPVATQDGDYATYLQLESADVVHNFWVPTLSGKTDLIPNRTNSMWADPRQTGVYYGNCAEYCGTQHANMLIRVIVENRPDFDAWAANQKKTPASGSQLFESLSCVNCHRIQGTPADGKFGPDLTHLMARGWIGAGVTRLTHDHLRAWVDDPQQIKPGCLMPSLKLTPQQLDGVVSYLETLK